MSTAFFLVCRACLFALAVVPLPCSVLPLYLTKSLEQASEFTPVFLGKLRPNIVFFLNQVSLDHRVWKEIFCRTSQGVAAVQSDEQTMFAIEVAFLQSGPAVPDS